MYRLSLRALISAMTPVAALAIGAFAAPAVAVPGNGVPQASITLTNCGSALCNANNTAWTLDKAPTSQPVQDPSTITWTVTATKGATTDNFITVNGTVTVKNTGTANATIGNIVVNLQKPRAANTVPCKNTPWVSAAADVADATNSDSATVANIVAAASTESADCNAAQGANNYTTSSAQGTFKETAGSGSLQFTDASDNSVFSLVPQVSLAPNQSITLLYTATFDNSVIGLPDGTPVRAEAIVTFGNAGARGGSGSSATNIDINGNGTLSADEANVRSVPCRVTTAVPILENGNSTVKLSDETTDVTVTPSGAVTLGNFSGFGSQDITATTVVNLSVDESQCTTGAVINNTASLDGSSSAVPLPVQIGTDPATGLPIYQTFTFACVTGVALDASANANLTCGEILPPPLPNACTYTKGGYAGPGSPGQLFDSQFATVFPSGLTIGIHNASNPPYDATWTLAGQNKNHPTVVCTGLKCYLSIQDGTPGVLNQDTLNATSTAGGVFPAQVATLSLNVAFDAAGVLPNGVQGLASLQVCKTGTPADGVTVQQILADANTALATGTLPAYVSSIGDLNALVDLLNKSFDNCVASSFAVANLCAAP